MWSIPGGRGGGYARQGRLSSGDDARAGESVQREVRTQHLAIDALFDDVRRVLGGDDPAREALEKLGRLEQALDTHFDQEDRLYFPPIAALRPEQKPRLEACMAAHPGFRARLLAIRGHLERDALEEATRTLEEVAAAFAEHEAAEEEVLSSLDRELPAGP